jgi:hypothetical protein
LSSKKELQKATHETTNNEHSLLTNDDYSYTEHALAPRNSPRASPLPLASSHLSTTHHAPHPRPHCPLSLTSSLTRHPNPRLRNDTPLRILRTPQRGSISFPWIDSSLLSSRYPKFLLPDFSHSLKASCFSEVLLCDSQPGLYLEGRTVIRQLRPIFKIVNTPLDHSVSRHCGFPLTLITHSRGSETPVPETLQPTSSPVDSRLCSAAHQHHWRFGLATRQTTDICRQRRYDLLYLFTRLQVG